MNIENLRMFCRVIEEGTISRAAREGYVSQPAVTKQVRQLEVHYDALLFDRQDGKLFPTNAGETLYPFAKHMTEIFEQSHEAVEEAAGEHDNILHIGASFTIGDYLLPTIMGAFKKKFPAYQFNVTIGNTPKVMEKLGSQDIDIALVESRVNEDSFITEPFARDELHLVIPADHRWNDRMSIRPYELPEETMIWREKESGTRVILEHALRDAGVLNLIPSSLELGSIQSIKSAVVAGLGISILPMLTVEQELRSGVLKKVPVADLRITRDLLMVRQPQRFRKQVVHDFTAFVREQRLSTNERR